MRNELSKAQIDEFERLDLSEEDRTTDAGKRSGACAPTGIKQLTNRNILQAVEEVLRVSRELYFPKADALGCS
ncbi:hypothetical protein CR105_18745 [Massilia eurypsychrophila]|jgi:hypothetical protein|uniref:Uncharacterized protein n=1 Tax=Massilia eurypsychrophila TaxID=1485217 RepID=A0A2G8TC28_9BURK|nr:hypothetical protein [Massilia eurypsychrophila]PIL43544.1 hypothetical protein CR105_18745 [Massilia eurypsychrophila]